MNLFPSPIGELHFSIFLIRKICFHFHICVSVPYRGATFLNYDYRVAEVTFNEFPSPIGELHFSIEEGPMTVYSTLVIMFPSPIGELHFSIVLELERLVDRFRPLSGSYISQYHPRNPMSCLGRIGGLRGKSNFIEMQPFWKVKNSHKSSI